MRIITTWRWCAWPSAPKSEVLGFLPVGWYPSALAIHCGKLYVGNSKGKGSYSDIRGPRQPASVRGRKATGIGEKPAKGQRRNRDLSQLRTNLKIWTKQVYDNTPYHEISWSRPRRPPRPRFPRDVGAGSPVKHVLYIIKENRTYDQVLGDLGKGNGDARLTIFGDKVTPNQHALAKEFVLLDNLYCDGEVSVDGHSWSNSAYATDFNEKLWP